MEATNYQCSACGAPVHVSEDGEITRTCEHQDAAVVANLQAVATGQSEVK